MVLGLSGESVAGTFMIGAGYVLAGLTSPAWAPTAGAGLMIGGACLLVYDAVIGTESLIKDATKPLEPLRKEIENLKKINKNNF